MNKSKWIVDVGGGFVFWSSLIEFGLINFDSEDVEDEVDGETNFVVVNLGVRYQFTKMLKLGLPLASNIFPRGFSLTMTKVTT